VKLLLRKGADTNVTVRARNADWTPLKVARKMKHTQIASLLEKAGAK
jgi:ankyrin repeat protein